MIEKTLVLVKPDGVNRRLVGEVIRRIENKGLKPVCLRMMHLNEKTAEAHYSVHKGKDFYDRLIKFITASPIVAMVIEGENAIELCRKLAGATSFHDALPGTIRGDYACTTAENVVHTSDSLESAEREISIFFRPEQILKY
ncbi:MAG: nucleoside-diphosphate kinase [Candidatus Wallbacteria bacterium]|nr:nucleoside-diphosphate kinase [Candidatus Wallbacteria bacterium]